MDKRVLVMSGVGALALTAGLILLGSMFLGEQAETVQSSVIKIPPMDVAVEGAQLPEDGKRYTVSVLVHQDWQQRPDERQIVAWWAVHPYLRSVASQTTYDVYKVGDPRYERYFGRSVREEDLPAVLIQEGSGKIHWKANVSDMPRTAEDMAQSVGKLFKSRPWYLLPWRRPKPCPGPGPCPDPDPEPDETDIDIDTPVFEYHQQTVPPEEPDAAVQVLVVLLVLGGVIGLAAGVLGGIKSRM